MIDQIDKRLKMWVKDTLPEAAFSLAPPGVSGEGQGVSCYLFELVDTLSVRGPGRPPLQLSLRYLVTTWAGTPEEAHALLGELVFAAMEHPDFEVQLDPLTPADWAAFNALPRPSFILRAPLRRERPQPDLKRVLTPLEVETAPIASLQGVVLGPGDMPVAGALVELPALQVFARADSRGQFHFPAVPGQAHTRRLRIRAKGREFDVVLEEPAPHGEPLVIRLDLVL